MQADSPPLAVCAAHRDVGMRLADGRADEESKNLKATGINWSRGRRRTHGPKRTNATASVWPRMSAKGLSTRRTLAPTSMDGEGNQPSLDDDDSSDEDELLQDRLLRMGKWWADDTYMLDRLGPEGMHDDYSSDDDDDFDDTLPLSLRCPTGGGFFRQARQWLLDKGWHGGANLTNQMIRTALNAGAVSMNTIYGILTSYPGASAAVGVMAGGIGPVARTLKRWQQEERKLHEEMLRQFDAAVAAMQRAVVRRACAPPRWRARCRRRERGRGRERGGCLRAFLARASGVLARA